MTLLARAFRQIGSSQETALRPEWALSNSGAVAEHATVNRSMRTGVRHAQQETGNAARIKEQDQ
jgi:hypothetical protein